MRRSYKCILGLIFCQFLFGMVAINYWIEHYAEIKSNIPLLDFTYFVENSEASQPSEAEIKSNWLWVINSSLFVVLLIGFLSIILLRYVKNDVARYLQVDSIDQEEMACARPMSGFHSMSSRPKYRNISHRRSNTQTIGLSMGGSKDTNNFRKCIEQNIMPSINSITYNGLFYQYYFDTMTRKYVDDVIEEKKENDESMLFYPSYCYAKTKKLSFDKPLNQDMNNNNNEREYYMIVGLNSDIKQNEFKRKHLNLVILLDISGSMGSSFDAEIFSENTKMDAAKKAIQSILKHLTSKDRLGIVTFNSDAQIIQTLKFVNGINMNDLKENIQNMIANGGTNFERGYTKTIEIYQKLFNYDVHKLNSIDDDYDNRIIVITDAQPNEGISSSHGILEMTQKYAENAPNYIYTTFIGVGLDFNSTLIQQIAVTRGCNYYSVKKAKEFDDTMNEEFEFMVTPLVFNVCLTLKSEGNSCQIEKIYGLSDNKKENDIINNGEVCKIHTLFPSKKSKETGDTKGGVQLIKLKKNNHNDDNINVELEVIFEDRNGKKYKNTQNVSFNPPKEKVNNDMIENDNIDFYDNTGIRKAILLSKYVELIKKWIEIDGNQYTYSSSSSPLKINNKYKTTFENFMQYFEKEMIECNDNTLQQEIDVVNKLINL